MQDDLSLQAYHYHLPGSHIAQHPAEQRDHSRLLTLNRDNGEIEHLQFHQITKLFSPGDLLVINDTRVFPARLSGTKQSGGQAEVFLLGYPKPAAIDIDQADRPDELGFECEALIKSSRPPRPLSRIQLSDNCSCILLEKMNRGKWLIRLCLAAGVQLDYMLDRSGDIPLPPYIRRPDGTSDKDAMRYQTVYAKRPGAVAAPTAGLHFTEDLLAKVKSFGVQVSPITLHVGYGTFAPVHEEQITNHQIHREFVTISEQTARLINQTRSAGGRVWAVGTTTLRALEFCGVEDGTARAIDDWCSLYIVPGYKFRIIDNLITNFHLPQSSLLFLVAALCGRQRLLDCYRIAIEHDYRFYSYGDAMAIIKKSGLK
jgi:S-adenosylmethionine:tRNA ribosyltransferase-isomerase